MSKPIHDYSPSELTTLRTRLESAREKITDEMISAGRGYEKSSETFQKSDPLALRFQSNSRAFAELHGETKRRIEYHGSLKKIKSNPVKYRPGSKCLVSCKGHGFYAGSGKKRRSIRLTRDPFALPMNGLTAWRSFSIVAPPAAMCSRFRLSKIRYPRSVRPIEPPSPGQFPHRSLTVVSSGPSRVPVCFDRYRSGCPSGETAWAYPGIGDNASLPCRQAIGTPLGRCWCVCTANTSSAGQHTAPPSSSSGANPESINMSPCWHPLRIHRAE